MITRKISLLLWILLPGIALANIQVTPMKVMLHSSQTGAITVSSKSADTQYIRASLAEIHHPGTLQDTETPVSQGRINSLVVTPLKFALPAGDTQQVRIVSLANNSEEKLYRVYYQSMTAEQHQPVPTPSSYATDLSVNVIWGVVIMVPPVNPTITIDYNPAVRQLINNGNIHINIKRIGLCAGTTASPACHWSSINKSIYPHQTFTPAVSALTTFKQGNLILEYLNDYNGKQSTLSIAVK